MRPTSPSRVASLSLMVFTVIALHVDKASALEIIEIKHVMPSALMSACDKVGGKFSSDGASNSCTNKNCDGKGGTCEVICHTNNPKCAGVIPLKQCPILAPGIAGTQQILTASPGKPPKSGTSAASPKALGETKGTGVAVPAGTTTAVPDKSKVRLPTTAVPDKSKVRLPSTAVPDKSKVRLPSTPTSTRGNRGFSGAQGSKGSK
jgi:hypothetical protein